MKTRIPTPTEVIVMYKYMDATKYTSSSEKVESEALKAISLAKSYIRLGYMDKEGLETAIAFIGEFKELMLMRIGK